MRRVMHGDVVAAARVIRSVAVTARRREAERLMAQCDLADFYRAHTGRAHPLWGDGSLMAAALARSPQPEPGLDDAEYCRCLVIVFDALISRYDKAASPARNPHRAGQSDRVAGV